MSIEFGFWGHLTWTSVCDFSIVFEISPSDGKSREAMI